MISHPPNLRPPLPIPLNRALQASKPRSSARVRLRKTNPLPHTPQNLLLHMANNQQCLLFLQPFYLNLPFFLLITLHDLRSFINLRGRVRVGELFRLAMSKE